MRNPQLSTLKSINLIGLMGQSNAIGFPFDDSYIDPLTYDPQSGMYIFEPVSQTWQVLQRNINNHGGPTSNSAGDGFGVEMRLLQLLYEHFGVDQYMIKYAAGGIPIAEDTGDNYNWSPNSTSEYMFKASLANYWAAMNSFPVQKIEMKVLIWIQGENDTTTIGDAGAYQRHFMNMANQIINQYNLPYLKFLNVGLGDGQTSIGFKDVINQAKRNITINNSRFVSSDGLATREGVHFTGDSLNTLAERIFDMYLTMI